MGSVVVDLEDNEDSVEIDQHYTNMAGHPQTQFRMHDIEIPETYVLTRGKDGFKQQLQALNWERLGSATLSNAIARCALEKALEYGQQREQFDQPIADFQGIEWKLAEMTKELEASRSLTYRAANNAEAQGRIPDRMDASLAKLHPAKWSKMSSAKHYRSTARTATSKDTPSSISTDSPAAVAWRPVPTKFRKPNRGGTQTRRTSIAHLTAHRSSLGLRATRGTPGRSFCSPR